ncbi:MAG: 6-phosphogluconolactonase [Propionibacteriaceae bacterium]|jgi:6-phosphogluconolactonase|nr:6-phosphogluconolactonase [Propionibacteriaceae bacterium]
MALHRFLRFENRDSLTSGVASLLIQAMCARQKETGKVSLCLTGGTLANEIYDHMAVIGSEYPLKANKVHLWWNWDYFVPLDNPVRNSLAALSRLGGAFSFDPAKIHPIPSSTVTSDPEAGAEQYAQELIESPRIDICLAELTANGQIAGIFPQHLISPVSSLVAGITDAPLVHSEVVTMTRAGLNTCREVWLLAQGEQVAPIIERTANHDPHIPASYIKGSETLLCLTDTAAASRLPFHHCSL